jgi:hypothetical protein
MPVDTATSGCSATGHPAALQVSTPILKVPLAAAHVWAVKVVPKQPLEPQQAPTGSDGALHNDTVQFWLAVKVPVLPQSRADGTCEQLPWVLQQLACVT